MSKIHSIILMDRKNLLKRKGMQMNNKMYGKPLSITTNGLKNSFEELLTILMNRFHNTRTNTKQL